jgi:GTP-binding protein
MFIDSVTIYVKAGAGGRGCNSLYRDKYTRTGIPDGGDGGRGADIIIRSDRSMHTLLDFRYNRHFLGKHGAHGSGNNKKGRGAEAVVINVPCGTTVKDIATNCVLRDLAKHADEFVVCKGGTGGRGNRPRHEATVGEQGHQRQLLLDLKVIADIGLVGFPNAGKSTLIGAISNAHPKIAAYPFTTKSPVLGVVYAEHKTFVVADIPGLIEGSAGGRGLGDKFLRHVERTRLLVHMIDMSGLEGRDPLEDYRVINRELKAYSSVVGKMPQVIVANKMDIEAAAENLVKFKKAVRKSVYPVSALHREGLTDVIEAIAKRI